MSALGGKASMGTVFYKTSIPGGDEGFTTVIRRLSVYWALLVGSKLGVLSRVKELKLSFTTVWYRRKKIDRCNELNRKGFALSGRRRMYCSELDDPSRERNEPLTSLMGRRGVDPIDNMFVFWNPLEFIRPRILKNKIRGRLIFHRIIF